MQEKTRVYALARELNVESKDLLDLCRQAGFDVKNQLSSLDPDQRDTVLVMLKKGPAPAANQPAPPKVAPTPVIPVVQTPVHQFESMRLRSRSHVPRNRQRSQQLRLRGESTVLSSPPFHPLPLENSQSQLN